MYSGKSGSLKGSLQKLLPIGVMSCAESAVVTSILKHINAIFFIDFPFEILSNLLLGCHPYLILLGGLPYVL